MGHQALSKCLCAEAALARAMHLISELEASGDYNLDLRIMGAQAAVAQAMPLVCGLQSDLEKLLSQMVEYRKHLG